LSAEINTAGLIVSLAPDGIDTLLVTPLSLYVNTIIIPHAIHLLRIHPRRLHLQGMIIVVYDYISYAGSVYRLDNPTKENRMSIKYSEGIVVEDMRNNRGRVGLFYCECGCEQTFFAVWKTRTPRYVNRTHRMRAYRARARERAQTYSTGR